MKLSYTYILECADGTLYTGWTSNPEKRLRQHQNGTGAKYTKAHGAVRYVYLKAYESKVEAMQNEWKIKQMSRKDKLLLIKDWTDGEN